MKKLLLLGLLLFPSISFAVDTYIAETGELYLPNVYVDGSPFEVRMHHQGDLTFQVTLANPLISPDQFPDQFSYEWLRTKTLYAVWHGKGEDVSGSEIDNVSVIVKYVFGTGYTVNKRGILNNYDSEQVVYSTDSNGGMFLDNQTSTTNQIIDHTSNCIVTQHLENGIQENIVFYCFTEQDAQDLADSLKYERMDSR